MSRYDFVIFGASGFTGQFVVEYLANAIRRERDRDSTREITWAVAGRSESKLRAVLAQATKTTGSNLTNIPVIICDISEEQSVKDMSSQARIVLNCVGPYRFYGEKVVSACIQTSTHHIDISGEPQFLERMQLHYNEEAEEKNVYVIGACGFDSIPSDLGHIFLSQKMEGDVNSVETFLSITTPPNVGGAVINFGTWQSAIYGFAKAHELKPIRRKLFPERLPELKPKLKKKLPIHTNDEVPGYCVPFPGSDRSVMMRTQRARYNNDKKRPTQIGCYVQLPNLLSVIMTIFVGAVFGILARFNWGRSLLENYPRLFSFGLVSKQGPSKEMAEETNFLMTHVGYGWKDSVSNPTENHDQDPNRKVIVTVSGKNVGYGSTCECMVQAGLVLLLEKDKMPGSGGVLTPGYAFENTSLVERLTQNGVPFTVTVKDF